jgi:hypothetical protein
MRTFAHDRSTDTIHAHGRRKGEVKVYNLPQGVLKYDTVQFGCITSKPSTTK